MHDTFGGIATLGGNLAQYCYGAPQMRWPKKKPRLGALSPPLLKERTCFCRAQVIALSVNDTSSHKGWIKVHILVGRRITAKLTNGV